MIGGADRVLVVLDDDHRVADVAEALERRDHLGVVLRVQADARLVEDVEHAHQAGTDLRRETDALRFAAGQRSGSAVEVQIVEADAEQELEAAADLLEHLASRVRAAPGRLHGAEERVQLVEVELSHVVDRPAADREERPGGAQPRAVAVGTRLLDHHLVEPGFHVRVRLAALAIAPIVALDTAGDAVPGQLAALLVRLQPHLGVRRRTQRNLPLDAEEDRLANLLRLLAPGRIEGEVERY